MKNIAILGSTGSIGTNTLELLEALGDKFGVVGLAAGANTSLLLRQVEKFRPKIVSLKTREEAEKLRDRLKNKAVQVVYGSEGAEEVARFGDNDIVVSAITGIEGLRPTLAAVRAGLRVALANKESLVVAGAILRAEAEASGAEIIPVDSEHSGIFQCLAKEQRENVKKVTLTASGGPFFHTPLAEIKGKSVEETLAHPRWKMGKKVTVDSATLMNKGLELIEARWLFGLAPSELAILIHPQSIVHSLVELRDGSTLAQLSPPDMKIPIQYALTYPERAASRLPELDLAAVKSLEFYPVDEKRFPLIRLARLALEKEKSLPVALNAANEVAVEAFLNRRIGFPAIVEVVSEVVEEHRFSEMNSLEEVFDIDRETREQAAILIKRRF
jgi:1-deoxy-D-xylulose-5-phosphate reductoisomerase